MAEGISDFAAHCGKVPENFGFCLSEAELGKMLKLTWADIKCEKHPKESESSLASAGIKCVDTGIARK